MLCTNHHYYVEPKHLHRFAKTTPSVFFYGHSSIETNKDLYLQQCHALSKLIDSRLLSTQMRSTDFPGYITKDETHPIPKELINKTKHAGVFIDTPGELCTMTDNIDVIEQICTAFKVNVILVVDNDPLHAQLLQHRPFMTLNAGIAISRIPKLLGTIIRTQEERLWRQKYTIQCYFRGEKGKYQSFQQPLNLKEMLVYSTLPVLSVPLSALPLGTADEYKLQQAQRLDQLHYKDLKINTIIALSFGTEEGVLATTPVAGFLHCQALPNQDDPVKSIQAPIAYCLVPNQTLPHHLKHCLMGTIVWNDAQGY